LINLLAGLLVVARFGYMLAYLADRPTPRCLIWTAGFGCVVALMITAATA
jgi:uncharacterized MAPEG superfamily protein